MATVPNLCRFLPASGPSDLDRYGREMPRPLRHNEANSVYHATARTIPEQLLSLDDFDRRLLVALLDRTIRSYGWDFHVYCLMPNHVHLVLGTPWPTLSGGMQWLLGNYARAFNDAHRRRGHLFEGRFRSREIESERDLRGTCRYVLNNPVRAGLCDRPEEWRWSGGPAAAAMSWV